MTTDPASTLDDVRPARLGPRRIWPRRLAIALLVAVVLAGAAGFLGVHSTTRTATVGRDTLTVEYASIARAGLDAPWTVTVRRAGGFDGPVRLAVTADYFDLFESQGLDPEPAAETADGRLLYWTFDPPPGEEFSVDFDAYIQPAAQWGAGGEISLLDGPDDSAPSVTVAFSTWLVP